MFLIKAKKFALTASVKYPNIHIMFSFNPGDKVICINAYVDDVKKIQFHRYWIVQNEEYTVRKCVKNLAGQWALYLEELVNPKIFDPLNEVEFEPGYSSHRFIKRDTISIINEMEADLAVNELLYETGIQTT